MKGSRYVTLLPLAFSQVEGLEVEEDVGYIEWLMAGGAPIGGDEWLIRSWETTTPAELS